MADFKKIKKKQQFNQKLFFQFKRIKKDVLKVVQIRNVLSVLKVEAPSGYGPIIDLNALSKFEDFSFAENQGVKM